MISGRLIHILLFGILAVGGCLYVFLFLRQSGTPKVRYDCEKLEESCKDVEVAKNCGVLDLCRMKWKTSKIRNESKLTDNGAKPVALAVYFESLCPDSEKFIITQLYPTFKKLLGKNIFTLELIPYGNAKESKKGDQWEFSCQHGEAECLGNIIETCAIHEIKNVTLWMPFIYCMEKNTASLNTAEKCCKDLHIDFSPIDKCRKGKVGNELEHEMGLKTQALNPKHTFIPWITVDGKSEGLQKEALNNLLGLICDTYQGVKPAACKE